MPDAWGSDAHLSPLREALTKQVRPKLIALAMAAFLLLLIGCVNVTNLLLAQGIKRNRELALREALGARRGRLVRQLLTESAVLISGGSLLGLLIAAIILRSLPALLPIDTPRLAEITLNTTLLFAVASGAVVAAILFAISLFIQLRNPNRESLTTKALTPSHRSSFLSVALIGGELALGATLIIGASLMGRTLVQLSRVNTGLDTGGVVSARVSFGRNACGNMDHCWASMQQVSANVADQLGVDSVSWANTTPLTTDVSAVAVVIEDHPKPAGAPSYVLWETSVTPTYFHQLGITLRKGRLFSEADRRGTEPVIVVSESTARHFWPQSDPIGKRIRPYSETEWRTVVGVMSDVSSYSLTGFPEWIDGVEYEPLSQSFPRTRNGVELSMFVKSFQPRPLFSFIEKLPSQFADIAVSHLATMERVKSESVADQRSTTALLALFAILGLLLAVVGVHGVVSHRVGQRTREIGIRLALGASTKSVVGMILMETVAVAVVGLVAGVLGATALTRFLQSLLFGVTSHDTMTFVISPTVLLIAALTAALVPALHASKLDPAMTLRQE